MPKTPRRKTRRADDANAGHVYYAHTPADKGAGYDKNRVVGTAHTAHAMTGATGKTASSRQ